MSAALLLKAEKLVKIFNQGLTGEIRVLSGLNFSLSTGRSAAIIGTSGVGKSTLLYILGGLDRPDKGRVLVEGRDIFQLPQTKLAAWRNRTIGFVFQAHHLMSEFSALENVAMPVLVGGGKTEEAFKRAGRILKRVGLGARLKHRPGELSGGEQQRVALARALVQEPKLLLADEPTGNLDARTGREVNRLIVELCRERGLTAVIVTHNPELAGLLDYKWHLVDGRIKAG